MREKEFTKLSKSEAQEILNLQWISQTSKNFQLPLFFNNSEYSSVFKILNTISAKLNLRLEEWDLEDLLAQEFSGIPYLDENKQTNHNSIFPTDNVILLLDNFNFLIDKDIKNSLHTIITERTINGHTIGENILLVFRGNYSIEKFNVMDKSLKDRFKFIELEVSNEKYDS